MNLYKDFIKSGKIHETLLTIVLLIYIIFDIPTPFFLLDLTQNIYFKVILTILIMSLFLYINPLISCLAIIAVFILFNRSNKEIKSLIPNENTKLQNMTSYNKQDTSTNNLNTTKQSSSSLEVEMVSQMAPQIVGSEEVFSFQSVVPKVHNAQNITDDYSLN